MMTYYTFESKIQGEEGTLIEVDKKTKNSLTVKWETDDYECSMLIERKDEDTPWDLRYVERHVIEWSAEGSFTDYADGTLYDFIEEALTTWESIQE